MTHTRNHSASNRGFAGLYLERYASGSGWALPEPDPDLFLSIVIPSYKEPGLAATVASLLACEPPGVPWEILVVINHPEGAPAEVVDMNRRSREVVESIARESGRSDVRMYTLWAGDLPVRKAGVGLARKIGMDEAVRRFNLIDRPSGIIAGFDADSACAGNYLTALVRFYSREPKALTANIHFEHPLKGDLPDVQYDAIAAYELYLRFLRKALEETGHPHAIDTVGSSFTVRASAYVRVNGMGTHQAGEDFYFLHKCAALGRFYEIHDTTVYPSARESDRVAFGTGATMMRQISGEPFLPACSLEPFDRLKAYFDRVLTQWPDIPDEDLAFLLRDTRTSATFRKRFFQWFDGFRVLKYLNKYHQDGIPRPDVLSVSQQLARRLGWPGTGNIREMLEIFRSADRARGIRRVT